jgi:hypothetical protein
MLSSVQVIRVYCLFFYEIIVNPIGYSHIHIHVYPIPCFFNPEKYGIYCYMSIRKLICLDVNTSYAEYFPLSLFKR